MSFRVDPGTEILRCHIPTIAPECDYDFTVQCIFLRRCYKIMEARAKIKGARSEPLDECAKRLCFVYRADIW
jgi:hypothetical protein